MAEPGASMENIPIHSGDKQKRTKHAAGVKVQGSKVQGSKVQACPVGVHHLLITHHSSFNTPILAPHQGTDVFHHYVHLLHIAASRHRAVFFCQPIPMKSGVSFFVVAQRTSRSLRETSKKEQSPPQALCTSTQT